MAFGARIEITNSGRILDALAALDKKAPPIARGAIAEAMKIAKKSAVRLAPRNTGLLRRAIRTKAYIARNRSAVIGELYVDHRPMMVVRKGRRSTKPAKADPFYYAHLVELGTKPHAIKSSNRAVTHPGSKAQPFLNPSLQNNQSAMEAMIEDIVFSKLEAEWEKS